MKVSIALATWNGAEYLQDQLDSYLAQERLPDELVASDDASSDDTALILSSFANVAPFESSICVNPERIGFVRNFNSALARCSGDIAFLSDQDDIWFHTKIAAVLREAQENPHKLLFIHDARLVREDLTDTGLTTFGEVRARGESDRWLTQGCCFAVRRELLEWALPIPDDYPFHDIWIAELAHDLGVAHIMERPLQLFRRHATNASSMTTVGRKRIWDADTRSVLNFRASLMRPRLERLRALSGRAGLDDAPVRRKLQESIAELEVGLKAIEARLTVLSRRRVLRTAGVLEMLASGQYAYFSGVRSALLDTVLK
jgi:glycosyltransferase involved in cell wall biosynthesis